MKYCKNLVLGLFIFILPLSGFAEGHVPKLKGDVSEESAPSKPKDADIQPLKDKEEKALSGPKGRDISLRDFGADDLGFLSLPMEPPVFGVLLVPDGWGLNANIKAACDRIAEKKGIALAVDLYNDKHAENVEEATRLQMELREESSVKTIQAGLRLLIESPRLRVDHVIMATWGATSTFSFAALRGVEKPIDGLTWFEPIGKLDERLLRKTQVPLQVVYTPTSAEQKSFIENMQTHLPEERQKLTFVQSYNDPAGFTLPEKPAPHTQEVWNKVIQFWNEGVKGAYQKERGLFERWFEKIGE